MANGNHEPIISGSLLTKAEAEELIRLIDGIEDIELNSLERLGESTSDSAYDTKSRVVGVIGLLKPLRAYRTGLKYILGID